MHQPDSNLSKLDFLRSIAVLLVVINHLLMVLSFNATWSFVLGQFGVLLFFLHTSYVLMMSLQRMKAQSKAPLWIRFMVRRCFRIYPLSILVLLSMLVLQVPPPVGNITSMVRPQLSGWEWISNLTLTMNFTRARIVLAPLWSLPYELTMYLFLPALFFVASGRRAIGRLVGTWMAAVALALTVARIPHTGRLDFIEFAPYFVSGVLAYSIAELAPARIPFRVLPLALAGIIAAICFADRLVSSLLLWPLLLFVAILVATVREPSNRFLRAVAHSIAKYSYGIYIAHVFCLWIAFYVVPGPLPLRLAVLTAALCLVPAALYHGIEAPMIRVGRRLSEPQSGVIPETTPLHARSVQLTVAADYDNP